jgi:predicted heme/steroid binding protein
MGGGISTRERDIATHNHETIRITMDEVLKHNLIDNSWTVYNGRVYDLTQFIHTHPGGSVSIMKAAGKDCTDIFQKIHPTKKFDEYLSIKCVGAFEEKTKTPTPSEAPPPPDSVTHRQQQEQNEEKIKRQQQDEKENEREERGRLRCDSPTTSWRKYCDRVSKKTTQSLLQSH